LGLRQTLAEVHRARGAAMEFSLAAKSASMSPIFGSPSKAPDRGDGEEEGARTGEMRGILFPCLHGPEARGSEEIHPGFVGPELEDKDEEISLSLPEVLEGHSPSGRLDGEGGPEGRVLAPSSGKVLQEIPRLLLRGKALQIQGDAVWPRRRSLSLRGYDESPGRHSKSGRYLHPQLPRRLHRLGFDGAAVRGWPNKTCRSLNFPRFFNKPSEVGPGPHPTSSLAGHRVGHEISSNGTSRGQGRAHHEQSQVHSRHRKCLSKGSRVPYRLNQLSRRLVTGSSVEKIPASTELEGFPYPGQRFKSSDPSAATRASLLVARERKRMPPSRCPTAASTSEGLDGCLRFRLGSTSGGWDLESRNLVQAREPSPHQRQGTPGSGESPAPIPHRILKNSDHLHGQYDSVLPPKSLGVKIFPGSFSSDRPSLEVVHPKGLGDCSGKDTNLPKRPSGRPLEGKHPSLRVVPSREHETGPVRLGGNAPDRLNGDALQQAGPPVREPDSSLGSGGGGHQRYELGQMDLRISVSSSSDARVGYQQDKSLQRESVTHLMPNTSLTSVASSGTQTVPDPPTPSATSPVDVQGLGGGLRSKILSMGSEAFLRSSLNPEMDSRVSDLIACSRRPSTKSQMESVWRTFQSWLSSQDEAEEVSLFTVLRFLSHLILDRSFTAGTIRVYKALLALPLRAAGIELDSWLCADLVRSAFLRNRRPVKRVPSWNLDRVLALLKAPRFLGSPDPYDLLRKALFLTALASGHRASELAHLDATSVLPRGEDLSLAVIPSFLYKNQRMNRFPPEIRLKRFSEDPDLCPVTWLNLYRSQTPASGRLFKNSRTGNPLSSASISKCLCSLIEEADPGCFPRGHDIRRVGTSLAWIRGTSPEDICKAVFWASSSSFVKSYLVPVASSASCIVPG